MCALEGCCVSIAHFKLHPKSCSSLSLALISHDLKHIIKLAWEAACFFHTQLLRLRFPPCGIKTVGFGFPKAHIASCYKKSESICECVLWCSWILLELNQICQFQSLKVRKWRQEEYPVSWPKIPTWPHRVFRADNNVTVCILSSSFSIAELYLPQNIYVDIISY